MAGHSKKAQSTAQVVSAAWGRILAARKVHAWLPHDPDLLDYDELKHTAAELRSKLTAKELMAIRSDYRTVINGLGYLPPLPGGR
jgi:hypothetical protein